jgi:hypothetical protein
MLPFKAEDFLLVREAAGGQHAVDRTVTLLARAFPGESVETLRRLPLGRRNARLLALRERLFGPSLEAYAECPHCGEKLEFALDADAFRPPAHETASAELDLDVGGYRIRFRLLDSNDLQAAAGCADVSDARAVLVQRCVLDARRGDDAINAGALPPDIVERLAERLEEGDPQAETLLDSRCLACNREWQIAFDIASFLQEEIHLEARRLLREVHALARGYGWREADILAMSTRRRRDYLELLVQ